LKLKYHQLLSSFAFKSNWKAPGTKRLKLKYHQLLSSFALKSNLRRYIKGVCWDKRCGKWKAECKGRHLGDHATEEAAARAYNNYAAGGVSPMKRRQDSSTSRFKGVSWNKSHGKWSAESKGKRLGDYATEEAAAQAGAYTRPLLSST
jgi:hypothetical protein